MLKEKNLQYKSRLNAITAHQDTTGNPRLPRSFGRARVSFDRASDARTQVRTLFHEGCLKLRLPYPDPTDAGPDGLPAELVVINTAGGMTGGDAISMDVSVGEGAEVTVTAPSAEQIYRSLAGDAVIEQHLQVARGGRLDWLPQETILFDQSRLNRRTNVELQEGARATIVESILIGRAAMGETVQSGFLSDLWTVRSDGRLIYADALRLAEPFARSLRHASTLGRRRALATVIHVGDMMRTKLDAIRTGFAEIETAVAGASLVGNVLVVRILADDAIMLRRVLIPALAILRDERPLPRLWSF